MHNLRVSGDIVITKNDTKPQRFMRSDIDKMPFKQHYTRKVIINGSLTVNNLERENGDKSKIILNDEPFNPGNIQQDYLLYNDEQVRIYFFLSFHFYIKKLLLRMK